MTRSANIKRIRVAVIPYSQTGSSRRTSSTKYLEIDDTWTRTRDLIVRNVAKWEGFIVQEETSLESSDWRFKEVGSNTRTIRGALEKVRNASLRDAAPLGAFCKSAQLTSFITPFLTISDFRIEDLIEACQKLTQYSSLCNMLWNVLGSLSCHIWSEGIKWLK